MIVLRIVVTCKVHGCCFASELVTPGPSTTVLHHCSLNGPCSCSDRPAQCSTCSSHILIISQVTRKLQVVPEHLRNFEVKNLSHIISSPVMLSLSDLLSSLFAVIKVAALSLNTYQASIRLNIRLKRVSEYQLQES